MTLWWIGNVVLLVVILPVVVYLLNGVLRGGEEHRPERRGDRGRRGRGLEGPRRRRAAADHAGQVDADGRGRGRLRRLARRDPRRRRRGGRPMPAAGVVIIVAVLLIVLALVYYLVSTIVALRQITAGLDEVIAGVGEIVEKSAPVNGVVDGDQRAARRGRRPARGPARQEGRPGRRDGPDRRRLPGRRGGRAARLPREHGRSSRRGSARSTRGHAHARAARPRGADRRRQPGRRGAAQRRGRQPGGARCSTPTSASERPEKLPRSPVIGTDAPVQYEQREDIGAPRKRLPATRRS